MTRQQRLALLISIFASFVAFLDSSVVNVALPSITKELGGGLATQQWVTDAYLITLGSLILAAGSFSDIFGRKKVLLAGLAGFAITSLLCAVAPNGGFLIISRALQGIAGAMLVPSSLALIISVFSGSSQAKAIGSWTAWTGIAFIVGPLVGGMMVDALSWRLVFAINILPIAITLWMMAGLRLHEKIRPGTKIDTTGVVLSVIGLAGTVYALIEQPHRGWTAMISASLILGLLALTIFIWHERRTAQPMLPLNLFAVRNFGAGNIATLFIYASLSLLTFVLIIFMQQVGDYSAVAAGIATTPITILLFLLSSRFGALSGRYGPRLFMTAGPAVSAAGTLLMIQVDSTVNYWTQLLPGILLFGVGLSITVAPLTAAILGSIGKSQAGIGSAINNAVARIAGLLAIAGIGMFIGSNIDLDGFHRSVIVCVVLFVLGSAASAIGIRNPKTPETPKI